MAIPTDHQVERYEETALHLSILIKSVEPLARRRPHEPATGELLGQARRVLSNIAFITSRDGGPPLLPLHAPDWLDLSARLALGDGALDLFRDKHRQWNPILGEHVFMTVEMIDALSGLRDPEDPEFEAAEAEWRRAHGFE